MADDEDKRTPWRTPPERPPSPAFNKAVTDMGAEEKTRASQARAQDGPKVAAMRAQLRQLEGQLGHGAPKPELKPDGTTQSRDLHTAEKERAALDKKIRQIDRVREQFNERGKGRDR